MRKNQEGLVPAIALIILAILAILISAGAYYLLKGLKGTGQYTPETTTTRHLDYSNENGYTSSSQEVPVSDSDKTSDIDAELNSTNIGEVESDIDSLELDSGSL